MLLVRLVPILVEDLLLIALLLVLLAVLFEVLTAAAFAGLAVGLFRSGCEGGIVAMEDDSRAASKSLCAAANCSKPKLEPLFEGRGDLLELRMEKSEGGGS